MYLSGLCQTVTLVHRRDEFRASKTMQERVLKNPKIKLVYNTVVEEVLDVSQGRGHRRRASATSRRTRRRSSRAPGFFVAIGHTPNTDLFKGQLELHDNGYIKTQPGQHVHERARRLRLRRRAGLHVPPGGHGGGHAAAWPRSTPSAGWRIHDAH